MAKKKDGHFFDRDNDKQVQAYVQRIEQLEKDKAAIADDIKMVYAEAEFSGYHKEALRDVIKLRKMEAEERNERLAAIEDYMAALGMLADTPLGEAALTLHVPGRPPIMTTASDLEKATRRLKSKSKSKAPPVGDDGDYPPTA